MESQVRFAGFWRRLRSEVIDSLITILPLLLVLGGYTVVTALTPSTLTLKLISYGLGVLGLLVVLWALVYVVYFEAKFGQTLGQKWSHLKIVQLDNPKATGIGFSAAIIHALVSLVSRILNLGDAWMLIDAKRQTWQDKAAKTVVIYDESNHFVVDDVSALAPMKKQILGFILVLLLSLLIGFSKQQ